MKEHICAFMLVFLYKKINKFKNCVSLKESHSLSELWTLTPGYKYKKKLICIYYHILRERVSKEPGFL